MPNIVVCVCTRQRPLMLAACLESLAQQELPNDITVEIVVVDNESAPNNRRQVSQCARVFPVPLHYVHQPDQGIPQARNAALDKALELGADWIAFIDDDEEAAMDWLAKLYGALNRHGRCCRCCGDVEGPDVVLGPVRYVYPEGAPKWRQRGQYGDWGKLDGQELPSAATNNVLFRASMVRKLGLRFADELRFAGSEDVHFFRRMHEAGARIIWTTEAIVYETVPWERITLRGHVRKSFRKGASAVESARLYGAPNEIAKLIRKAARRGSVGIVKLGLAPLTLALGPTLAMKTLLSGCRGVSEALGVISGFRGRQPEYYRHVTGR